MVLELGSHGEINLQFVQADAIRIAIAVDERPGHGQPRIQMAADVGGQAPARAPKISTGLPGISQYRALSDSLQIRLT